MGKIDAPLGAGRSRYAPRLPAKVAESLALIEAWLSEHPKTFVSMSGGKDSAAVVHLVRQVRPDVPVVFYDSGIEYRANLTYIKRLTQQWDLDMHVFPATPPALDVLEASGQWEHGVDKVDADLLHTACITVPSQAAQARFGTIHSMYGLRADESRIRLILLSRNNGHITKHDTDGTLLRSHLAPIWRWTHDEVWDYLARNGVPENPLYGQMERLGIPRSRSRVGMAADANALTKGRWALTYALDPDLARVIEKRLPILREFR